MTVDLDKPGAVGDLDTIFLENDLAANNSLQNYLKSLECNDPKQVQMIIRIFSVFIIRNIRKLNAEPGSRYSAFEELGWIGSLVIEGAVDIIEHSWVGTSDEDAVEYQYWACGILSEFDQVFCEDRIISRLTKNKDVKKRVSLIQSLAVLADQNHLSGLRMSTVNQILNLFRDVSQPVDVQNAAREALVDDILRIDKFLRFLDEAIRLEITRMVQ